MQVSDERAAAAPVVDDGTRLAQADRAQAAQELAINDRQSNVFYQGVKRIVGVVEREIDRVARVDATAMAAAPNPVFLLAECAYIGMHRGALHAGSGRVPLANWAKNAFHALFPAE